MSPGSGSPLAKAGSVAGQHCALPGGRFGAAAALSGVPGRDGAEQLGGGGAGAGAEPGPCSRLAAGGGAGGGAGPGADGAGGGHGAAEHLPR